MTKYEELATKPCPAGCYRGTQVEETGAPELESWKCNTCNGTGLDPATEALRGEHRWVRSRGGWFCLYCDFWFDGEPGYCIPTSEAERIGRSVLWTKEQPSKVRNTVWSTLLCFPRYSDFDDLSEALAAAALQVQA